MTTTNYADNILAILDRASTRDVTEGLYWYSDANSLAARADGDCAIRGAAVMSVLSPRLLWRKNVEYTFLAYTLKGYDITDVTLSYLPVLGNSRKKALAIVNGADPFATIGKGLKTNAFFHNIANPFTSERVTIDKHASDIAHGLRTGYANTVITNRMYAILERAYIDAAMQTPYLPMQVQAITWCVWRRMHAAR